MDKATAMLLTQSKQLWIGLLLTFFFGGFSVFYVSIVGGIIMGILELIFAGVAIVTFGLGIILIIPLHICALIWVIVGIKRHNNKLIAQLPDHVEPAPVATPMASSAEEPVLVTESKVTN